MTNAGHTASWGKGYPKLLTQCYDEQGVPNGQLGPLDPTRNSTYNALWLLFREAAQVFPDSYLHLGGDEVPFDCWQVCLAYLLLSNQALAQVLWSVAVLIYSPPYSVMMAC